MGKGCPNHRCFKEETVIINHNMSALFAQRQHKANNMALDKNMEKLAAGQRIVRAGDDASGLAVSRVPTRVLMPTQSPTWTSVEPRPP